MSQSQTVVTSPTPEEEFEHMLGAAECRYKECIRASGCPENVRGNYCTEQAGSRGGEGGRP